MRLTNFPQIARLDREGFRGLMKVAVSRPGGTGLRVAYLCAIKRGAASDPFPPLAKGGSGGVGALDIEKPRARDGLATGGAATTPPKPPLRKGGKGGLGSCLPAGTQREATAR